jgi:hypothetical protein
MQTYRGPVALREIEAEIGPFDRSIIAKEDAANGAVLMSDALGYLWSCGCEARGNGTPLCVWHPCTVHGTGAASSLPLRDVPPQYDGGIPVPKGRVREARPGDVIVSAQRSIEECRLVGSPFGFIEDGKVIREYPDGRRVAVASV